MFYSEINIFDGSDHFYSDWFEIKTTEIAFSVLEFDVNSDHTIDE